MLGCQSRAQGRPELPCAPDGGPFARLQHNRTQLEYPLWRIEPSPQRLRSSGGWFASVASADQRANSNPANDNSANEFLRQVQNDMPTTPFDASSEQQFREDGYVFARGLFDDEEIQLLRDQAKADRALDEHAMESRDGEGGAVRLSVWNHPGDDIYGMVARSARVVRRAEQLLGDEVYHYHSKVIMKDAKVGGAWAWHQDYGYWYHNGVLAPDLCSVFLAVDQATMENGCLQVLRGSHRLGRIDHLRTGDQAGADPERVAAARERLECVYCEMQPGDALFFHANLLHRSDQNKSDSPRWSMVCCYNARSNDPYKAGRHPGYTKLVVADDGAVKLVGRERRAAAAREFLDSKNRTAEQLESVDP